MGHFGLSGAGAAGAGPFSPSSIPGLQFWVKADAITPVADGTALATWADSSGLGRDLVQASSGSPQPLYKTSVQNGLPVVRFNGSSNRMKTAAFTAVAQPYTLFFVWKWFQAGTSGRHVGFDGLSGTDGVTIRHNFANVWQFNYGNGDTNGTGPASNTIWDIWNVRKSGGGGANGVASINGAADVLTDGNAGTNSLVGFTLGVDYNVASFAQLDVAEIILYDSTLSTGNQTLVVNYLNAKWAVF